MIVNMLLLALALAGPPPQAIEGGVTFYSGRYVGRSLACPGYRYAPETGPWLAVDVGWFADGSVQCGDWFAITFSDGSAMMARALDSGYLADATVWDSELPMVADLPKYWRAGRETATGTIFNVSAMARWQRAAKTAVSQRLAP